MSKFTKYDQEMLEIFRDPVKWATYHLGEAPRWYQAQILRHPHHRKVLRCGRRVGKCIEGSQRILNPQTGSYETIESLYQKQKKESLSLITLNDHYQLEPSQALAIEDNGASAPFLVRTKYGAEVILTGNHPVLTIDGWVEVDALKIGDRIATPKALPYFGSNTLSEAEVKWMAYLLAGGYVKGSKLTFHCANEEIAKDFQSAAQSLGYYVAKQSGSQSTYHIYLPSTTSLSFLEERKIPDVVFTLTPSQIALFLRCLYSIDGWIHAGTRPEIGYLSNSPSLIKDMKHLLLRFGVISNATTKKKRYKGEVKEYYQLIIHRKEDMLRFLEIIGMEGKDTSSLLKRLEEVEATEHTIPKEIWKYIEQERKEKRMSKSYVAGSKDERLRMNMAPSVSKVKIYAENLQSAFLYDIAHADVIWEEVTDIIPMGMRQTYDVYVPETHNLVVEDILVHNTWTMCAHMLWVAFTCNGGTEIKKGATCVVATPYDNQARLIFDQLRTFIENSPILQESVKSITKNPYVIEFKNKSVIRLFTAGTRSGAEGGSLRGQKASWLYMDKRA